jgi:hypothetical protein
MSPQILMGASLKRADERPSDGGLSAPGTSKTARASLESQERRPSERKADAQLEQDRLLEEDLARGRAEVANLVLLQLHHLSWPVAANCDARRAREERQTGEIRGEGRNQPRSLQEGSRDDPSRRKGRLADGKAKDDEPSMRRSMIESMSTSTLSAMLGAEDGEAGKEGRRVDPVA